jgi:tetratricopeptide (TPR) repeat protein
MYVITFYSFKGGVGRTMALVNVAVELAKRGRNVLVVDFDLEAPGISTFERFATASKCRGLVDYVTYYLEHEQAPMVEDYVTRCSAPSPGAGVVWVMPAGLQDASYAAKLNSIDWQRLYSEMDGFLLFEDLKNQWRETLRADYVLIDSRTGHTDVGGICTRQLPDAVVAMFLPNEQNLAGLKRVVRDIRQQEEDFPRDNPLKLHFVPSNIPSLDDEERVLQSRLDRAKQELGYSKHSAIVRHYSSLDLLEQVVFTADRPHSRLSREYLNLVDTLIAENLYDREGALKYLDRMLRSLQHQSSDQVFPGDLAKPAEAENRLDLIEKHYPADGELLVRMAAVNELMGNPEKVILLADAAIKSGYRQSELYRRRAVASSMLSRFDDALEDMKSVLWTDSAAVQDVLFAVRWIIELRPSALVSLKDAPGLQLLEIPIRIFLASQMMVDRDILPVAEDVLRKALASEQESAKLVSSNRHWLTLNLIGQRRFSEAMQVIIESGFDPETSDDVVMLFNYSMAEWGHLAKPVVQRFARVIGLSASDERDEPNFYQCLALSFSVVGDREKALEYVSHSLRLLKENPRRQFSAWRYLQATPDEFRLDLNELQMAVIGESIRPTVFLDEQRSA